MQVVYEPVDWIPELDSCAMAALLKDRLFSHPSADLIGLSVRIPCGNLQEEKNINQIVEGLLASGIEWSDCQDEKTGEVTLYLKAPQPTKSASPVCFIRREPVDNRYYDTRLRSELDSGNVPQTAHPVVSDWAILELACKVWRQSKDHRLNFYPVVGGVDKARRLANCLEENFDMLVRVVINPELQIGLEIERMRGIQNASRNPQASRLR